MAGSRWHSLSLALLFCGVSSVQGAFVPGRFTVAPPWTTIQGLPQNSIFALTQTRDGYLWLGTGGGLARFDGQHFQTFDESNTPLLGSAKAVKLFEDSRTNLWIATDTSGLFVANQIGELRKQELGDPSSEGPVVTICEDRTGSIWVRMSSGRVYRVTTGKAGLLCVRTEQGKKTGWFFDFSRSQKGIIASGLMADSAGLIWIAEEAAKNRRPDMVEVVNRLQAFNLSGEDEANLPSPIYDLEVPAIQINFLLPSPRGGFWVGARVLAPGTNGEAKVVGNVQRRKADGTIQYYFDYSWPQHLPILAACEDLRGNLVVGTYGDYVYWHDPEGHATRIDGLSHAYVFSMVIDREGDLWVGTNGKGLNRVKHQAFQVLDLPALTIRSVAEEPSGGIWFGFEGGLGYWRDGRLQEFGKGLQVHAVMVDRAANVWVGTEGQGLFQKQGDFFQPSLGPDPTNSLRSVNALYQDSKGRVWVGSSGGLACWDGARWQLYTTRDGLLANVVQALAEDVQGSLWVGTTRGLNRLSNGQISSFSKSNGVPGDNVLALYADAQGVWVGTSGGLGHWSNGTWTRFSKEQGLLNNTVSYLLEDPAGFLWLGSTAGLMRIEKKGLEGYSEHQTNSLLVRAYGEDEGLPSGECTAGSQPAACRSRDGKLWFPTINGLAWVDPATLTRNPVPPQVRIEAVRVDDQLQTPRSLRAALPDRIVIPPGKETVEIDFTSLNLSAPQKARVAYKLEGYETVWTEKSGDVRYARYSNLSPGHFLFRVKACNEDWVWNEEGAVIGLDVLPPFWRTWSFIAAMSVLLLGAIIGSVHLISTQRLQRQVERLRHQEALERERARIARDLHDQLGANLTQVALLGELAEADKNLPDEVESHARQISQTARETTHALDEIVWTVNPSNDTLDGLINYVCKYAQEYFALAGLRYRLEVPPDLPNTPITPELRHNLFLAAKESINNIVKHARADSTWLRLNLGPKGFLLEIEDNGRGLSAEDREKGRSGLHNLRKRMEDVGGTFEIGPRQGGGTVVRLKAPLTNNGTTPA